MSAVQIFIGAVLAMPLVLWADRRRGGRRIYAQGLVVAALIYVVFALAARAGIAPLLLELLGVALFGAVAWQGGRRSALWLAAGWAVHVGWDLLLHPLTGAGYAPAWYVRACVGFDLMVAAWIAFRPEREIGR
ncbi:MAG: DUF6010 family protein [Thermoanaerobaculia bacterium]